jgi:hypothetical protein
MLAVVPAAYAAGTSTISGKVTEKAAKSLSGVSVKVSDSSLGVTMAAQTGESGEYTVSGLPPGTYTVEFGPPIESTFAPQYYKDAFSSSEATGVTILTEGEKKSEINATLRVGGTISGKVEGPHGEPIQGAVVSALGEFSEFATTGPTGEYSVTGLAKGSYVVEFLPPESSANLVRQFYNGVGSFASATPVEVTEEEAKPNINARLQEGGEISGTVTDAATQQPLGEVCVTATNSHSEFVGFAVTAPNGTYVIHGLEQGSDNLEVEYCPVEPGVEYMTQSVSGVAITPGHASDISVALVRSAPVNTVPPVLSGTPAVGRELSCSTGTWTGRSPLEFTYTWLRDGGVIAGASAATYLVQPADQGHALACQVTATNSVSHATAASNIVKVPPPAPTVETKPASSITATSATLNGTVNPNGGAVSECKFEYGTTIAYGKTAPCTPAPGSGLGAETVSAPITGLTPNTTYDFRVLAKNAGGTTDGANETLKTFEEIVLPPPPPPPPPSPPSSPEPSSSPPAPPPPPPSLPTSSSNSATTPPALVQKPLTNSQKLAKALTACKKKPKRERKACEAKARKLYRPKHR